MILPAWAPANSTFGETGEGHEGAVSPSSTLLPRDVAIPGFRKLVALDDEHYRLRQSLGQGPSNFHHLLAAGGTAPGLAAPAHQFGTRE